MTVIADSIGPTRVAAKATSGGSLRATIIGNALEWFDWTIYATFSPYIARALFAPTDSVSALLQTLAIFAVGFIARPIGGIVFGRLADKRGRKLALVLTMMLMAVGSLVVALTPSYARIGALASLWLLFARLIQGFAHGGETSASYVYVSELAPAKRRGLWSSTVFASATFGGVVGSLIGVVLTRVMAAEDLKDWGWRIPFILGALLGIYAYYLRRSSIESDVFEAAAEQQLAATLPAARVERRQAYLHCLRLFVVLGATVVAYYTWLSFATAYAITAKGVPAEEAFVASLAAQVICVLALPLFGIVSDRIGRKPLALLTTVGFVVMSFPLDNMFTSSPWSLFWVQSIALLLWGSIGAIYPALMAEQFATGPRALGIGVAYSFAAVIFGGTAPYLNTWLTSMGSHWIFTAYTVGLNAIATIAVLTMRETKGLDLKTMKGAKTQAVQPLGTH
jgi:MHS family alpha-ketoglutarate permease-like MFS transporter